MPYSEAFTTYVLLLIQLADLMSADANEGPECDALRDQMDTPWYSMTSEEQDILDAMSADLWYLSDGGPQVSVHEPTPDGLVRLTTARAQGQWIEVARLLHDTPRLADGLEGARIRLELWEALGQEELVLRFRALVQKLE